jgi:chromosome segregation ATPase
LSSESDRYRDQYDSLDTLVEALRTDNGWLEYQLQIVLDELLNQGAQAASDASAVDRATSALLKRDEALQKAHEDLTAMRAIAAEWKTELASTRAQLQQDRATLEGARSWKSQAEEKAKEAEQLRANLADSVASLAATEEQLQQEQSARQQVETRLQQERSVLEEARATLEHECMAREEAQGQLQRERAMLEEAQATLKLRDEEVTRLNGELAQLSVSYEDQLQAGKEKNASILELQQAAEAARAALETEKKQVQGELPFPPFTRWLVSFGIRSQSDLCLGFQACRRLSGTQQPKRRPYRRPTTLLSRSWRSCRPPPSRRARALRKAGRRPGAPW